MLESVFHLNNYIKSVFCKEDDCKEKLFSKEVEESYSESKTVILNEKIKNFLTNLYKANNLIDSNRKKVLFNCVFSKIIFSSFKSNKKKDEFFKEKKDCSNLIKSTEFNCIEQYLKYEKESINFLNNFQIEIEETFEEMKVLLDEKKILIRMNKVNRKIDEVESMKLFFRYKILCETILNILLNCKLLVEMSLDFLKSIKVLKVFSTNLNDNDYLFPDYFRIIKSLFLLIRIIVEKAFLAFLNLELYNFNEFTKFNILFDDKLFLKKLHIVIEDLNNRLYSISSNKNELNIETNQQLNFSNKLLFNSNYFQSFICKYNKVYNDYIIDSKFESLPEISKYVNIQNKNGINTISYISKQNKTVIVKSSKPIEFDCPIFYFEVFLEQISQEEM